ncbi:MAG: hypothetical protein MUC59_11750 [Saprospiraceae bacterium]|jgi:hypothetical protein|nr:hypothetical protein [Saprospiraceae bacterium]
MAVEPFLEKFLEIGVQNGYFELSTIGSVDKSCCTAATTEIIDFDKLKEKLVQEKGLQTLKSCDGLKILPNKERIDFVEMKGVRKLLQYTKNHTKPVALKQEISDKFDSFNFLGKIRDSWTLLTLVASLKEFIVEGGTRNELFEARKHLVILTDIDPNENAVELIALNLQYLATFSTPIERQISELFANALDAIPEGLFLNFQKPVLKSCKEIDAYYGSLSA